MDLGHDVVFALDINVRCGLIKEVHRCVMQQRAGQCQPLALAAGEVAPLLGQRCIQPLQHGPERVVRCIRPCHAQVLAHGTLEQIALVADVGDVPHEAVLGNIRKRHTADRDRASIAAAASHKDGRDRGLAAAERADDRCERTSREREIEPVQDLPLRGVGKMQPLTDDVPVRAGLRARRRLRQIEQAKDLFACCHAVHGNVEKRAELPHGNEKVCRQQDDQQRTGERNMPRAVLRCCENHAQRCTAIGNDVHDRDGIELHGQDLHGDLAEFFRFLIHDVVAQAIRLIDFQRGQPLQILQKGIAELRVLPPVARQELFCPRLHRRNCRRDERHAYQQHDRCRYVDKAQYGKERQRREHGVEKLRQISAEIRLKLIHALDRDLHDLRRGDVLGIRRAEAQQLFIDLRAQRFFHRARRQVAHARGAGRAQPANEHGRGRNCRRCQQPCRRGGSCQQ